MKYQEFNPITTIILLITITTVFLWFLWYYGKDYFRELRKDKHCFKLYEDNTLIYSNGWCKTSDQPVTFILKPFANYRYEIGEKNLFCMYTNSKIYEVKLYAGYYDFSEVVNYES